MEEFLKLKWKIEGPHELDYGPDFISESEILNSYIYKKSSDNKVVNPSKVTANKIPDKLYPGYRYKLKSPVPSFLSSDEHSKCLTALKILQTGKKGLSTYERGCVELYNNAQQRILEENKKFLAFARKNFENKSVKAGFTKPIQNYAEMVLKKQSERCKDYPRYYKEIDTLLYCYKEDETPIEMVHLANLLEVGSLAKFTRPTLLTPYHMSSYNIPDTFETFHFNLPVSKDLNAKKLLGTHEADVVISSSGLKKLLNFTETNSSWDIPICIEEIILTKTDGSCIKRNVVFIDKPLPNMTPSEVGVIGRTIKLGLKANFCTLEALKYSCIEEPLSRKIEEINPKPRKIHEALADDEKTACKKVHRNASYRLWHLRQEDKQSELMKSHYKAKDVKVLVRCKLDACEAIENTMLQPLTLYPKLEHQPAFGASIPSKTELSNEWTSVFFRPFSQVCRIRIACASKEVLMLENCNLQKINNELNLHYNYKPSLGLGVLYKLFLELKTLAPGNYLLRHLPKHGTFVSLLQSSCNEETFDLYQYYNINKWEITKKCDEWCPIDSNIILPKHLALGQMPGLFPPKPKGKILKNIKFVNKKKIKKKKQNKQNKDKKNKSAKL